MVSPEFTAVRETYLADHCDAFPDEEGAELPLACAEAFRGYGPVLEPVLLRLVREHLAFGGPIDMTASSSAAADEERAATLAREFSLERFEKTIMDRLSSASAASSGFDEDGEVAALLSELSELPAFAATARAAKARKRRGEEGLGLPPSLELVGHAIASP